MIWCPKCRAHLIDPRYGTTCPVCQDDDRRDVEKLREGMGWR